MGQNGEVRQGAEGVDFGATVSESLIGTSTGAPQAILAGVTDDIAGCSLTLTNGGPNNETWEVTGYAQCAAAVAGASQFDLQLLVDALQNGELATVSNDVAGRTNQGTAIVKRILTLAPGQHVIKLAGKATTQTQNIPLGTAVLTVRRLSANV